MKLRRLRRAEEIIYQTTIEAETAILSDNPQQWWSISETMGDENHIRIRFLQLTPSEEQNIRKFLQRGVMQKTLIPLTRNPQNSGSEKREDFRVAFHNSRITIGPADEDSPESKIDCQVVNMSAGGFMVETRQFFQFRPGQKIEFRLNFLEPGKTFLGIVEGFSSGES